MLAYRRGDDGREAMVGAMLESEHFALFRALVEGLGKKKNGR